MNDDLKPNDRNQSFRCASGAFMLAKLVVLRHRDCLVNEHGASEATADALSKAADAIEDLEVAWATPR